MGFWRFIARRVVITVPVLLIITLIGFVLTYLIPADPLAMALSERALANPAIVRAYKEKWGLDRPPPIRYLTYVGHLVRGDLGQSIATGRPVSQDLLQFAPATAELAAAAMCVAVAAGIPLGILAATHRGRWVDHLASTGSLIGISFPVFWLGLVALAVLYFRLGIFPGPSRLDAWIPALPPRTGLLTVDSLLAGRWDAFVNAFRHLMLPAGVLGAYAMGNVTRITRATLIDVFHQDFIRTARAKGLHERTVLVRHALRSALIPTVTIIGLAFGGLMGGAVTTETVFAWPGIGRYAVYAASKADFPAITGVTLLVAAVYVAINFLVDLSYALLDPRIRLD